MPNEQIDLSVDNAARSFETFDHESNGKGKKMIISRKTRITASCIAGAVALGIAVLIVYFAMQPSLPDSYNAFRDHPIAMGVMFMIPVVVIVLANIQKKKKTT